ncbi:hypothetical protein R1flu_008600 [Riccia fluitans]|uniref:Uncharacterized protein n=1 Tax=Riccia fluitans TaxID=41844 RepID=A0ABD1YCE4_9MARC
MPRHLRHSSFGLSRPAPPFRSIAAPESLVHQVGVHEKSRVFDPSYVAGRRLVPYRLRLPQFTTYATVDNALSAVPSNDLIISVALVSLINVNLIPSSVANYSLGRPSEVSKT